MNKEELMTLPTRQGTSHCSCLEHCFLFCCFCNLVQNVWTSNDGTKRTEHVGATGGDEQRKRVGGSAVRRRTGAPAALSNQHPAQKHRTTSPRCLNFLFLRNKARVENRT